MLSAMHLTAKTGSAFLIPHDTLLHYHFDSTATGLPQGVPQLRSNTRTPTDNCVQLMPAGPLQLAYC